MPLPIVDSWRAQQRATFTSWEALADFLELDREQRKQIITCRHFPLKVPYRLAAKMEKGRIDDPLLIQFLPTTDEELTNTGYCNDPVGDNASRCSGRLLHKYHGRLLLMPTSSCAMHCRYCFRQHFDYAKDWGDEMAYIAENATISEVILSGGDPLSLSNERLGALLEQLAAIPHLRKVRFHTRFPIGIPERVDAGLVSLLGKMPQQVIFIIHCNHPHELGDDLFTALSPLQRLGIPLLSQTVLLHRVNDCSTTLHTLFETLSDNGILPYYLHQLDRVAGAAHFEVTEEQGIAMIEALRRTLPGYAVPRYVREVAGAPSKQIII